MFSFNHFTRTEVTKSNDPTRVGAPINYNPENSYRLWNRYDFRDGPLAGLGIGAGLRHRDAARLSGDRLNVVMVPAFTVYDLMLSYSVNVSGRRVVAQLNFKNCTNRKFREDDGFFADARKVIFSLRTRF